MLINKYQNFWKMPASLVRNFQNYLYNFSCYLYFRCKQLNSHLIVIVCVPLSYKYVCLFCTNIIVYTYSVVSVLIRAFQDGLSYYSKYSISGDVPKWSQNDISLNLFRTSYYMSCLYCHLFNIRFLVNVILQWILDICFKDVFGSFLCASLCASKKDNHG
jgi:hypothetical protein